MWICGNLKKEKKKKLFKHESAYITPILYVVSNLFMSKEDIQKEFLG